MFFWDYSRFLQLTININILKKALIKYLEKIKIKQNNFRASGSGPTVGRISDSTVELIGNVVRRKYTMHGVSNLTPEQPKQSLSPVKQLQQQHQQQHQQTVVLQQQQQQQQRHQQQVG